MALRAPLSTPSINLAGKPSRMGGTLASVAGWLVLLVGLSITLGFALLLWAVFSGVVAAAVTTPFALIATVIGWLLIQRGSSLRQSGVDVERETRDQALLSMAGHHGPVTAVDAARLLNVTVPAADAMLTELAKRDPDRMSLDVDDQGVVWYRLARPFAEVPGPGDRERVRVDGSVDAVLEEEDELSRPHEGQTRQTRQVRR